MKEEMSHKLDWGLPSATAYAKKLTPGQGTEKKMTQASKPKTFKIFVKEAAIDAKGHKSSTGGLTKKGVDAYNRANPGSNLQTAVTTKPSKLKPGSKAANRRKIGRATRLNSSHVRTSRMPSSA